MTDNSGYFDFPVSAFPPGTRVELHPSTDLFMMGCRYGTVVRSGYYRVLVRLDVNGHEVNLRRVLVRPVAD